MIITVDDIMLLRHVSYVGHFSVESADDKNSNVLFFQLQLELGTYLPMFRLDALAILRVRLGMASARASSRNI